MKLQLKNGLSMSAETENEIQHLKDQFAHYVKVNNELNEELTKLKDDQVRQAQADQEAMIIEQLKEELQAKEKSEAVLQQ